MHPEAPIYCPQCGAENESALKECGACGVELAAQHGPFEQPVFEMYWSPASVPWRLRPESAVESSSGTSSAWGRALRTLMAAGETAKAISLSPESAFQSFRASGGFTGPVLYSILLFGPCLVLNAALKAYLAGDRTWFSGPLAIALLFLVPLLYLYLRAQAVFLTLVLTGRAKQSFEATFRVVGYANSSVAPLLLLPYAGDFLFLVGGTVVEATGLRRVHRLTAANAALVEMIPVTVLILCLLAAACLGVLWWSQTRA